MEEEKPIEKIGVELRDAFGHPYTVSVLPRKKIVEILENLDVCDIVEKAYQSYCPGLAKGVAQLNIEDGSLVGSTYTTGSGDIQGMHYIDLYSVEQNLDLERADLFTPEEMKLCNEKYEGDYKQLCEKESIDHDERVLEALVDYAYDYIRSENWWRDIEETLDSIYEKEEENGERGAGGDEPRNY